MWHELPEYLLKSDVYYIQDFFGVEKQLERFTPQTPMLVGPIVDPRFKAENRRNQLLIELGGLRSKLIAPGRNSQYPHLMGKILSSALRFHNFDKVIVVGDTEAMLSSMDFWQIPRATFGTLSMKTSCWNSPSLVY